MTQEEIEKAAHLHTEKYSADAYYSGSIGAFISGANWRIKKLWHDASEKPDMSKEIIVIYPDKSCRVFRPNGVWETLIEVDKFIRWAYV